MPDIVDPENGTHINRLTVVHHTVEAVGQPPSESVVMIVDAGARLSRDEVLREIEELHVIRDEQGRVQHNRSFELDDHYHHRSWGADAASLAFVVQAAAWFAGGAASGIVGNSAYDGLKAIGQRIRAAVSPAGPPQPKQIDDLLAIKRAKQMAAAAFKELDSQGFTVLSVSIIDQTATVLMRDKDGSTFTVQPSMFDGGAVGTIVRAYPEHGTEMFDPTVWETIAAWTGALLTGVSVALGVGYYIFDRRRERRAQAGSVVVWLHPHEHGPPLIKMLNLSDKPVFEDRCDITSKPKRKIVGTEKAGWNSGRRPWSKANKFSFHERRLLVDYHSGGDAHLGVNESAEFQPTLEYY